MPRGRWISAAICSAGVFAWHTAAMASERAGFRLLRLDGYAVKWVAKQPAAAIALTYRIADREISQPDAINCQRMRAPDRVLAGSHISFDDFRRALAAAFDRWRDIANVTFVEAAPGAAADIVVGEQIDPTGFAFTNLDLAKKPANGIKPIVGASICLNPERHWKIGYDGNLQVYDLVYTFAHEIGHVIGLDHPAGRANLMSFRYSESLAGLSDGDKQGAIALYGPSHVRTRVVSSPVVHRRDSGTTTTIGRSITSAPENR